MERINQEPRKLIKFGNSSYIISLPKPWVIKHKLKKGDLIYLEETSKNELILTSKRIRTNEEPTSLVIEVDNKEIEELKREITSAYIGGYGEIIIRGKTLKEKASKIIMENVGMEILEETKEKIVLKDILDFDAIYTKRVMKRMDNIIRSMFEDLKGGLEKEIFNEWIFKEIKRADTEINKLYFLLLKIIRKAQTDAGVAQQLKMDNKELSDLQWFVLHLEYTGDEIKRIARIIMKNKINKEDRKNVLEVINAVEKSYLETLKSYYSNDKSLARKKAGDKRELLKVCEKTLDKSSNKEITLISEKVKWIIMCIHNFAKIIAY